MTFPIYLKTSSDINSDVNKVCRCEYSVNLQYHYHYHTICPNTSYNCSLKSLLKIQEITC